MEGITSCREAKRQTTGSARVGWVILNHLWGFAHGLLKFLDSDLVGVALFFGV